MTSPPDILDDDALTIYVDGSMYEGPRRGGMGVLFVWVNDAGDEETWDHSIPSTKGATNNEMELEAPGFPSQPTSPTGRRGKRRR
jgi:hypothetical protein